MNISKKALKALLVLTVVLQAFFIPVGQAFAETPAADAVVETATVDTAETSSADPVDHVTLVDPNGKKVVQRADTVHKNHAPAGSADFKGSTAKGNGFAAETAGQQKQAAEHNYTYRDANGLTATTNHTPASPSDKKNFAANQYVGSGVDLIIPDPDVYLQEVKGAYSTEYGYDWDWNVTGSQGTNGSTTTIHVQNLDWDLTSEYYVAVSTNKYFFVQKVTASDAGTAIAVDTSNFSKLQSQVPFKGANPHFAVKVLTLVDSNKKPIIGLGVADGALVQPNTYNVQINAYDDQNVYALFKKDVTVNGLNSTVSFSDYDLAYINVNPGTADFKLTDFAPWFWDGFNTIYWASTGGKAKIVVTKQEYEGIGLNYHATGYDYLFAKENFYASGTTDLKIEPSVKAELNLEDTVFEPNEWIYGDWVGFFDGSHQMKLDMLWDNNFGPVQATATFEDLYGNKIEVPVYPGYPEFPAPEQPGVYELTLSLPEQLPVKAAPASVEITVGEGSSYSSDVSFFIPEEGIESGYATAAYKEFYGEGSGDYEYYTQWLDVSFEPVDNGTLVKVYGLDWWGDEDRYVAVTAGKYTFMRQLKKEDAGTELTVNLSSQIPVKPAIPNTGAEFAVDTQLFTYLDANSRPILAQEVLVGGSVEPGIYNVQVNAHDVNNGYMLLKKHIQITQSSGTFAFSASELAKVTPTIEDSSLSLKFFASITWDGFNSGSFLETPSGKPVYVVKQKYHEFVAATHSDDDWWYDFSKYDVTVSGDQLYKINTDLRASIILSQSSYEPGQLFDGKKDRFSVLDGYGNTLSYAESPDDYEENAVLKFTNKATGEDVTYWGYIYEFNHPWFIQVPEIEGTYALTYEVYLPFDVDPAGATINVGTAPAKTVSSLTVNPTKINARPGDEKDVTVTANYTDGTNEPVTNQAVWTSSNNDVATFNDGVIKVNGFGQAALTAAFGGKTATVQVDSTIKSIIIGTSSKPDLKTVSLKAGGELQLVAKATFSDSSVPEDVTGQAEWNSDNESVTVDAGYITVSELGKAKVTAAFGGKMATIDVSTVTVKALIANVSKITGKIGDEKEIIVTAKFDDGSQAELEANEVAWSSDNTDIADVHEGLVVIKDFGKANIKAEYGNKSVVIPVDSSLKALTAQINNKPVTKAIAIKPDDSREVSLIATLNDNSKVDVTDVAAWEVDDESIVSVDAGVIYVNGSGKAVVKASYGDKTVTITVDSTVKKLTANVKVISGMVGAEKEIALTATFADNSKEEVYSGVEWYSDDEDIAIVDNGFVTITGLGKTKITATYGGLSISIPVDSSIKKLVASTTKLAGVPGEDYDVILTATFNDNSQGEVTEEAEWASNDEDIATVDAGVITVNSFGKTTVSATYGGKTVVITVDASIKSLAADTKKLTGKIGDSKQITLTATVGGNLKVEVTEGVTWSSNNVDVAEVDDEGIVYITGFGKAVITADYGGKKVTIPVEVTVKKLSANVTKVTGEPGDEIEITLTAVLGNGDLEDPENLLAGVVWSSSNEDVATADGGIIYIHAAGKATITASYYGKTVKITVTAK